MAYDRTFWQDHVTDQGGAVIQQGTPLDQQHFNKIEKGISDDSLARSIMQFKQIQEGFNTESEIKVVTLSMNSGLKWPFNNTPTTVALSMLRENTNYDVNINVLSYSGGRLGSIIVTDRALNGFKLVHDGSATTVKVAARITGGLTDPEITE